MYKNLADFQPSKMDEIRKIRKVFCFACGCVKV